MVAERADIRTKASELGNASIIARLESQQLLVETRSELEITRAKIASRISAMARAISRARKTSLRSR